MEQFILAYGNSESLNEFKNQSRILRVRTNYRLEGQGTCLPTCITLSLRFKALYADILCHIKGTQLLTWPTE